MDPIAYRTQNAFAQEEKRLQELEIITEEFDALAFSDKESVDKLLNLVERLHVLYLSKQFNKKIGKIDERRNTI